MKNPVLLHFKFYYSSFVYCCIFMRMLHWFFATVIIHLSWLQLLNLLFMPSFVWWYLPRFTSSTMQQTFRGSDFIGPHFIRYFAVVIVIAFWCTFYKNGFTVRWNSSTYYSLRFCVSLDAVLLEHISFQSSFVLDGLDRWQLEESVSSLSRVIVIVIVVAFAW